jgi:hypothetical protein
MAAFYLAKRWFSLISLFFGVKAPILGLKQPRGVRAPPKQQGSHMMAQPRFSAGERVSLVYSKAFTAPAGIYRIVRALPRESGPRQYRIKNETENFERVVDESRIEAFSYE